MAQHDYVIANDTAANVRADINNALEAIAENNSGASAPATTYPNQWWYDTSNNILKIRNEADTAWINAFTVNQADSQIEFTTVNATNYGDGTDSVPASAVLEGTAKAYINYDQVGVSVSGSYNVSSITDNSAGNFTVNFTNDFANNTYGCGAFPRNTVGASTVFHCATSANDTQATGSFGMLSVSYVTGTAADITVNAADFTGDLA